MLVARRPAASGYAGLVFILVKCGNVLLSVLSLVVGVTLGKKTQWRRRLSACGIKMQSFV